MCISFHPSDTLPGPDRLVGWSGGAKTSNSALTVYEGRLHSTACDQCFNVTVSDSLQKYIRSPEGMSHLM